MRYFAIGTAIFLSVWLMCGCPNPTDHADPFQPETDTYYLVETYTERFAAEARPKASWGDVLCWDLDESKTEVCVPIATIKKIVEVKR